MKVKVRECDKCRKEIFDSLKKTMLEDCYNFYDDIADSFACYATTALLTAMSRRGKTKKYIQQLYDDMCFVFNTDSVFGNQIRMTELMKNLEEEYGIDFKRIRVRIESKKEFIDALTHD